MNAITAKDAASAIVDAFKGEAAAAHGYVTAYVNAAGAVANGVKESDIAKAIKESGSPIKAGADLVGDFVLTAPLVSGDNGLAASAWIREKFGDTPKRVHTVVTSARAAKGQGKPVVRSILAPVVAILTAEEFDPDAYATAVARALSALSKIRPIKDEDTDEDTDEGTGTDEGTDEGTDDDAPATFRSRLTAVEAIVASLVRDYADATDEDRHAYDILVANMTLPIKAARVAA